MGVDVQGQTGGAGLAGFVHGEKRRPGDQPVVFDSTQQSHQPLHRLQAGVLSSRPDLDGEVDQLSCFAERAGGNDDDAAGAQQRQASGENVSEPRDEPVVTASGEVMRGLAVGVVPLTDTVLPAVAAGAEVAPPLRFQVSKGQRPSATGESGSNRRRASSGLVARALIDQAGRFLPELVTSTRLNGHTWHDIAQASRSG
ncbi:hypothetical protein [Actinomadura sp. HBU206391]|uniref:hypothetical protein n=1 Tax=Actinomadura sp. HBU206391 TaxID=2731692 RepID=UPI00164FF0A6|nr:hypothetical protein [Actinomadura sp. HBU206391]MBC6458260.1 hypothetical protein [Actinomadura sp. HBU206391]